VPLSVFHPVIAKWFRRRFSTPTDVQIRSWPEIRSGKDVLIAAPTGSGKTLAAFLTCIDGLFKQSIAGTLADSAQVLYVSPLKALSNDVQKNLQQPLSEITEAAIGAGLLSQPIRVTVRTGDTPMSDRQQMLRKPPHILITTPESLYLLLTAARSRRILETVHTVIVDEIHAVAPNKRGSHLSLTLERLNALTPKPPVRIGLSATQRPIELVADFLVGNRPRPTIVDIGHRRKMDLAVEVPKDELSAVATNAIWSDIYDRLAALVMEHRSTLVFVNTRRLVERVAHNLEDRLKEALGSDAVAAHHGSLSRQIRLSAEERLKTGKTRVVVATASLELGIDIGDVDLVCQIGSPRSIAVGLQRAGRSGHWVGALPKARFFAGTRDELIECAAIIRAIRTGDLDRIDIPPAPLDILSQQIVASVAAHEWRENDLFTMVRRAYPYRGLERRDFDAVLRMLSEGVSTRRSRGQAYLHHDRINHRIRARRGARLAAITSGGAIPDTANYVVVSEPEGVTVGTVDEDFAVESLAGDIMLLGNTSWRIRGVETGRVRVEDAHGAPPTIPFWRGEAPSRTFELSGDVGAIRERISELPPEHAVEWLQSECGLDRLGAEQAVTYIGEGRSILGTVATQNTVVAERFFDEGGGMQLVLHAPFGGRINKAWGLALRKRFCTTFDFELQAAATDEGIVVSLGERHSFPLNSIFGYLHPNTLREVLVQSVLQAPMFTTRWRWNATRSLAMLRFANGKKVPPQIQRMRAEDLLGAVFPMATACQDNHPGGMHINPPDHPLVQETLRDCLTEAMDIDGLTRVLQRISSGEIRCVAIDTPAPSAFCHEILNANPYAYLDDAPLEERRARAVEMRRSLPPEMAGQIGALDPEAIAEVAREAWPVVRDRDELHDALLTLHWVPETAAPEWRAYIPSLVEEGRVQEVSLGGIKGWVATERLERSGSGTTNPEFEIQNSGFVVPDPDLLPSAYRIVQGWMESIGPTRVDELASNLGFPEASVNAAMLQLESEGQVLRGSFRVSSAEEWCDRRLLARIHRLTIGRLRKEIQPAPVSEFMKFLFQWQHVAPGSRLHGEDGLLEVIHQLAGFEAAASSWERYVLPARMAKYDPELLDRLCLNGSVMWARLSPHPRFASPASIEDEANRRRIVPTSAAPIGMFAREDADWLMRLASAESGPMIDRDTALTPVAQDIRRLLEERGASFFADIARETGHLQSQVEDALWELSAGGVVTADGFDSLRALLDPKRRQGREKTRRPRHGAGRWSLLVARRVESNPVEQAARQFLRRYGVVFRDLLARESLSPSWRDLLIQFRRLEFKGAIRGGRFVDGFVGEQFALPEAVESLRAMRRDGDDHGSGIHQEIKLSAADPLNLVGVILPGARIPSSPGNYILFRNGVPIRSGETSPVEILNAQASAMRSTL
jgi:ATP-dependent Lhr-like helicase